MRKIETQMSLAFDLRRDWRSGNTSVQVSGSIVEVYLHGHLIARQDHADALRPGIRFTLAGWNTPTTRSRLNALGARVFTRKGQAYAGTTSRPIANDEWFARYAD